ncbi:hypothetical protein LIER_27787 [Lithospermum erythrorhizon]|uniref:Uncharacterized protein n=1 Tax=Lithospermum erythrorhizon TaxID=34254 RepID=A0AAV3RGR3_LITER
MFQLGLPKYLWGEAILTATCIANRLPTTILKWKTPFERLHSRQLDISLMRIFGCLCFVTVTASPEKVTQSARVKTKSNWLNDYVSILMQPISSKSITSPHVLLTYPFMKLPDSLDTYSTFLVNITDDQDPSSYKQASTSPS